MRGRIQRRKKVSAGKGWRGMKELLLARTPGRSSPIADASPAAGPRRGPAAGKYWVGPLIASSLPPAKSGGRAGSDVGRGKLGASRFVSQVWQPG